MSLTVTSDRIPSLTSWTRVDVGLWVAQRDGAHLGRVDAADSTRFDAFTGCGAPLGSHLTLRDAQLAVEAQD
jgi:hypothetical protein